MQFAPSSPVPDAYWTSDWAWGLPLIVLTVLIHVLGLVAVKQATDRASAKMRYRVAHKAVFAVVMGCATLLVTGLHGLEAIIWATAYRFLGALPNNTDALLYSLNAITSYGHTNLRLEERWHLMGALEALNGWLLFGLTTAFLFAIIQRILLSDRGEEATSEAASFRS